jgi:hypothetical protein
MWNYYEGPKGGEGAMAKPEDGFVNSINNFNDLGKVLKDKPTISAEKVFEVLIAYTAFNRDPNAKGVVYEETVDGSTAPYLLELVAKMAKENEWRFGLGLKPTVEEKHEGELMEITDHSRGEIFMELPTQEDFPYLVRTISFSFVWEDENNKLDDLGRKEILDSSNVEQSEAVRRLNRFVEQVKQSKISKVQVSCIETDDRDL